MPSPAGVVTHAWRGPPQLNLPKRQLRGASPEMIHMTEISDFVCPNCKSRYKLVRMRSEPGLPSRLIHCRVCKEPLTPTDGACVLKYFLIEAAKRNGFDLQMKHSAQHGAGPRS